MIDYLKWTFLVDLVALLCFAFSEAFWSWFAAFESAGVGTDLVINVHLLSDWSCSNIVEHVWSISSIVKRLLPLVRVDAVKDRDWSITVWISALVTVMGFVIVYCPVMTWACSNTICFKDTFDKQTKAMFFDSIKFNFKKKNHIFKKWYAILLKDLIFDPI